MIVKEWNIGSLRIKRFCTDISAPAVYVHGAAEGLENCGWTMVLVDGIDWNRDLTPWPAKAVFRGQPDFGGEAKAHLRMLTEEIIPVVEDGLQPASRGIMGYSLAGLFAAYAALESGCFDFFASVSGSMWYPGFVEYATQKEMRVRCAYFSVGDREKLGRNAAFHSIEECTQRVCDLLAMRGAKTVFELNPGGHFENVPGRMRRAAEWLKEALEEEERREKG